MTDNEIIKAWNDWEVKCRAINEFAERLKTKVENIPWCEYHLVHTEIDNLVKEMTEGGEGK